MVIVNVSNLVAGCTRSSTLRVARLTTTQAVPFTLGALTLQSGLGDALFTKHRLSGTNAICHVQGKKICETLHKARVSACLVDSSLDTLRFYLVLDKK